MNLLLTLIALILLIAKGEDNREDFIDRVRTMSAWKGHDIFAHWLMYRFKPNLLVELGVDYGYSLVTFSRALSAANPQGGIIAVDLFNFEFSPGHFRNTLPVVQELKDYYGLNNIILHKSSFADISRDWELGKSIDVLHIDGHHEYKYVDEDYRLWQNKVKENGIVLFHDVFVFINNFGVYKRFGEITEYRYKGYFKNDYGLGVATNNKELFDDIVKTFPSMFFVGSPVSPN